MNPTLVAICDIIPPRLLGSNSENKTVVVGGEIRYSTVTAFIDKKPTLVGKYVSITTSANSTLHLSGNHNVYTRKSDSERFLPM